MIQGDFHHVKGAKTIGTFCGHFGFVVESLHATGATSEEPKSLEAKNVVQLHTSGYSFTYESLENPSLYNSETE